MKIYVLYWIRTIKTVVVMGRTYFQVRYYDRENPGATPIIEPAIRNSVQLDYKGSTTKVQDIIGSVCDVSILDPTSADARFEYFYTSDETRWRTQIWFIDPDNASNDRLYWQGHIMPEQYEEPYTTDNLRIKVRATDGLGRLKGFELPDAFYTTEQSVIAVLSECLRATGSAFELYFSPAITNAVVKEWENIYVSGSLWQKDNDVTKRESAYAILKDVLRSLQCVVYQDWARWFVVGYNKQTVEDITYRRYDAQGVFLDTVTLDRTPYDVKEIQLVAPTVNIVTPRKNITVTSAVPELALPAALSDGVREDYAIVAPLDIVNVGQRLLFRNWLVEGYDATIGTDAFFAPIVRPDRGKLVMGIPRGDFNAGKYVRLERKLFVVKGQKIKADFGFNYALNLGKGVRIVVAFVVTDFAGNEHTVEQEVRFDDDALLDIYESFDDQLSKEFIVRSNGYLDILMYKPTASVNANLVTAIELETISIEEIDYVEEEVCVSTINEDYSIEEDVPLPISDVLQEGAAAFRLAKLEERTVALYDKDLDIKSVFAVDGVEYVVLDLRELFFVDDFRESIQVQQGGAGAWLPVTITDVIYNYQNGEQMVFAYDAAALGFVIGTGDSLRCQVKDYVYPAGNRESWQQWVDDVYGILPARYCDVVAGIYRNLYNDTHNRLRLRLKNVITFSTLISFHYKEQKTWFPINLKLFLDTGYSEVTLNEAYYGRPVSDNIPPIVDAGPDQELSDGQTTASLLATAADPDGVIVSQVWTVVSGTATIDSPNTLATTLSGVTGDSVTLQITVTDDDGATASDTLTLARNPDYTIVNTILENTNDVDPENQTVVRKEQLVFTPVVPAGQLLTIEHNVLLQKTDDPAGASTNVFFECRKNGQLVAQMSDAGTQTFSLSYISGDVITYEVSSDSQTGPGLGSTSGLSRVRLQNFDFQTGLGTVANSPYTIQASSSVSG